MFIFHAERHLIRRSTLLPVPAIVGSLSLIYVLVDKNQFDPINDKIGAVLLLLNLAKIELHQLLKLYDQFFLLTAIKLNQIEFVLMHQLLEFLMPGLPHHLQGEALTVRLHEKLKLEREGVSVHGQIGEK